MDAGALEALRSLAQKIDVADLYFDELAAQAAERKQRPPAQDNVSLPTYLKYCESLGLTPAGRSSAGVEKPKEGGGSGGGGTLGKLQGLAGGKVG